MGLIELLAYILPQLIYGVVLVLILSLLYIKWCFKYWERRKVPYLHPTIPFGNLENPSKSKKSQTTQFALFYEKFKTLGVDFGGVYSILSPVFVPINAEHIKSILVEDFQSFHARGIYSNKKDQPISANIISMDGSGWQNIRTKMTPTFSSGKLKLMFEIFLEAATPMKEEIETYALNNEPVIIKAVNSCYIIDVISSCAFGLQSNSFRDPSLCDKVQSLLYERNVLLDAFCFSFPDFAQMLKIRPIKDIHEQYFTNIIVDIIDYRQKNGIRRNDFLQLLIDTKTNEKAGLSNNEIVAQSLLFYIAGFETSTTTMTYCLFELCQNLDIQRKVRDEVKTILAKYQGKITYDAIMEMTYLQKVVDETLRKYPPLPMLNRSCTEDYKIHGTDIVIEKGTKVAIPILAIHRDPDIYPDPDKFDPERFSDEAKSQRHPYLYLPFGAGPRNCIGSRFGLLQTKVGLTTLLQHFEFALNSKTSLPLEFNTSFFLVTVDDIFLDVKLLNK